MTTLNANEKATRFEIRYQGAPYGENEAGELVSWHKTREAAERELARLRTSPKHYSQTRIVEVSR